MINRSNYFQREFYRLEIAATTQSIKFYQVLNTTTP